MAGVRRTRVTLTILLVIGGVAGGGFLFERLVVSNGVTVVANAAPTSVFDHHFRSALSLLRQGRAKDAVELLNEAARLRPHVAEVHVNRGFALLAIDQAAAARQAFTKAIDLKSSQANAYFGLAESLERLGDLPGALGAMRTFIHLSPTDDPFRRRAMAATWEWQSATKRVAPETTMPPTGASSP